MSVKRLTVTAMLAAAALIIFIIEAQLPPLAPIPGIKLGLANVVTLYTMAALGRREALMVTILRIILGSVFAGGMMSLAYSAAGGALCYIVMAISLKFLKERMLWCVSVIGAIGHNIGQLAAAVLITGTVQILWYAPILIISAIITGIFTGAAAQQVLKRTKNVIGRLLNGDRQH